MDAVGTMSRMASVVAWMFAMLATVTVTALVIVVISAIAEAISNYRKFKP